MKIKGYELLFRDSEIAAGSHVNFGSWPTHSVSPFLDTSKC